MMDRLYIRPKSRTHLAVCFVAMASFCVPAPLYSSSDIGRTLSFYHTHTGERLEVTYAEGDVYFDEALEVVNGYLGDFRNGEQTDFDPALLDFLFDLRAHFGGTGTYQVISAYRSPATNEMLRSRSSGVARQSQHLLGKAIDVRLEGVDVLSLRDEALAMKRGGVGYYKQSKFVHVDTGRVRHW
jgi:uncharacterized protein YcbK (DUF882 family)